MTSKCVAYIECTARCSFANINEVHPAKPERNRHANPVYEGSKLLCFTQSSLVHVRELYKKYSRLGHLDLWLCKTVSPAYFFAPDQSLTSSCRHISVCGGDESGPTKRKREPPGHRPMKRR